MDIIKLLYNWCGSLCLRKSTDYIVMHHRAGNGDADSIHKQHLSQGYSGIGYHYYVRKNGQVFQGRPIDKVGAHCKGYNDKSVGVCFEGNFENEKPTKEQLKAGNNLVKYILNLYPQAKIVGHKDLMSTACPGNNFNINEILNYEVKSTFKELISVNDIVWELANRGILSDKNLWLQKLKDDENAYWLARKCVNYIRENE